MIGDELTLLGALQLRWHTRLAGRIERNLMNQPMDLEQAVVTAWHSTAAELPSAVRVGAEIEARARATFRPAPAVSHRANHGLIGRIKAALAA